MYSAKRGRCVLCLIYPCCGHPYDLWHCVSAQKAWDSGAFGDFKFSEEVWLTCVFHFWGEIIWFLTYIEIRNTLKALISHMSKASANQGESDSHWHQPAPPVHSSDAPLFFHCLHLVTGRFLSLLKRQVWELERWSVIRACTALQRTPQLQGICYLWPQQASASTCIHPHN